MPSESASQPCSAAALRISVIMPVYNGAVFLAKSLPPLVELLGRGEVLELLVVDDGSEDQSAELAQELGARVLPSGGRLGAGGARNQAALVARGDLLWFVDADVVVHADAAQVLCAGFKEADVAGVFGSYDDQPEAQNFLSQYKNLVHHFYHQRAKREASTFWSGCGAIRKALFLAQGGFDVQKYKRPSIEDIELGYRLKTAGGRLLLLAELRCTHLKEWRLINLIHTEVFCRALPWSRLMLIRGGFDDDLNVGRAERLRAALAGCLCLSLLLLFCWQPLWPLVLILLGICLWANRAIFGLFLRRGGLRFGLAALGFHQIYYLYSSMAFAWALFEVKILGRTA